MGEGGNTRIGGMPVQGTDTPCMGNLVRETWLQYFNDYLRDRQIITEEEWRKMRRKISTATAVKKST